MQEELVRGELPIQSIYQRDEACTATVPIHLDVLTMPAKTRTDLSLIVDAIDTVKIWYDKDMEYYLSSLAEDGITIPGLETYERFRDDWQLGAEPDKNGFLTLFWSENQQIHTIRINLVPVILHNQHDESGEFYTPESWIRGGRIEIVYRNIYEPEIVVMDPDKMKKYGRETDIAYIDREKGVAEVVANAFSSDYHMNLARTLLLRDFAVFYLNKLLGITKHLDI